MLHDDTYSVLVFNAKHALVLCADKTIADLTTAWPWIIQNKSMTVNHQINPQERMTQEKPSLNSTQEEHKLTSELIEGTLHLNIISVWHIHELK